MTILDRANAFIGHEQEVDEGYETTMRRNAFIAGYEEGFAKACEVLHDFAFLVYQMREAQGDFSILNGRITYKVNNGVKVDMDEYKKHAELMNQMVALEDKVGAWIQENYNYSETDYEQN